MPSFSLCNWSMSVIFSKYVTFKGTQGKKTPVKRLINCQHFFDNPITPGGLSVIQNLQNLVRLPFVTW